MQKLYYADDQSITYICVLT